MARPLRVRYVDPGRDSTPAALLDADGIEASAVGDGDALDALDAADCVVAVHRPPTLDGSAFVAQARDRCPGVPVVLYGPDADPADGEAALAAGATDWLPVDPGAESAATVARRVEDAVERAGGSPERFEETLARITDAFFALDTEWRFTYANDRAEEVLERDRDELLGNVIWEAFPGAVDTTFQREYERAMETQQPASFEEFYPPLSTWFAVRAYPSETGLSVYFRDVTERVERAEQLEQYRAVAEAASDAIVVIDEESVVVSANPAVAEVFGYEPDELVGEPITKPMADDVAAAHREALERYLRTGERTVDWNYVELPGRDRDGREVPLLVSFDEFAFRGDRYFAGVIRDDTEHRRFEQTLTTLHEATRDLVRAESREEVCEIAVDTATDVLDLSGVGVYLYDADRNRLRPEAYSADAGVIYGEVPTLQPGEGLTGRAFVTGETLVIDDAAESELVEHNPTNLRSGLFVPLGDHGVLVASSTTADAFDDRTVQLVDLLAATTEATLDRVAREADLRERERELSGQADRLERLVHLAEKLRAVERALVAGETRAGIEEAVCEVLANTDRYEFAWIGEPDHRDGTVTPTARAGEGQGYLDAVSIPIDDGPAGEPAGRTAATGEPTLVADVAEHLRESPWAGEALSRDLRSALAVPVAYDDVTFGVLTVYAGEPSGFDELAADVFAELGETVGFAIDGVETRAALVADRVVELELAVHDAEGFLVALADEADCQVEFEGEVASADGGRHVFFTARGVERDRIVAVAADVVGVESVEVLGGEGDDRLYRATVSIPTLAREFASLGALTRSITAIGDEARVVVELPRTTDVRAFVTAAEKRHPGVELVARRERDRPANSRQGLLAELEERLTDRQQEALRTAYLGGFFETPRRVTAVELGEMLDISQPTFTAHLRAAERKFLDLVFGDDPGRG